MEAKSAQYGLAFRIEQLFDININIKLFSGSRKVQVGPPHAGDFVLNALAARILLRLFFSSFFFGRVSFFFLLRFAP